MKQKWRYGVAAAIVAVIIAGSLLWSKKQQAQPLVDANIPVVHTTAVSTAGTSLRYTYAGEVRGRYESKLAFQVGGKVIKRSVELGSNVLAGDVLMQLDSQDLQQVVNSHSAQVAAAQAQLTLAESNLSRYRQLYAQAAVSRAQLDQYQNAYDIAAAAVHQSAAQYKQGANQLGYAQLVADQPGVVADIGAEAGQVVGAGQAILTIVQGCEREIEISVPENRLTELRQAGQCQVTFWALPGVTVNGIVREMSPVVSPVTRTYKARIALVEPPPAVKLGMTAAVIVVADGQQDTTTIPLSALYQAGSTPGVWVVRDHTVSLRPVTVGSGGNDTIEVLTGLKPGEIIVTAGVHKLREGQQVRPDGGETR